MNRSTLSPDSGTRRRSPEVSSTAFDAQPPDLPPAVLMDVGFAAFRPLARCRRPLHPVLVHRLAPLLHASFRPRLATTPLRFAITSPPSRCEEDFHLQAVKHARHTKMGRILNAPPAASAHSDSKKASKVSFAWKRRNGCPLARPLPTPSEAEFREVAASQNAESGFERLPSSPHGHAD